MQSLPAKLIFLLAITLSLYSTVFSARSLDEYKDDIQAVRNDISWLIQNPNQDEAGLSEEEREVLAAIRDHIPPSEEITVGTETIQTSNEWVSEGIKNAEAEQDLEKRLNILIAVDERLASISIKIDDLLAAQTSAQNKDADKQKLSEILKREEYKRPEPKENKESESALTRLVERFLQWLGSWFPSMAPATGTSFNAGGAISGLYYLVIGLIIALAAFILYKLVPIFLPDFKRKPKDEKKERIILGEKIDEDVSSTDLFAAADELARKGDLRGAIRKGYVALLCELSDRHLIGLARHKTNRDYLRDVRPRQEIYQEMNGLTGSFERHWYGEQRAENEDWDDFRRRCGDTIKAI